MARRLQSLIDDAMNLISKLPWWAGLVLALISYLVLHWYATQVIPATLGANDSGRAAFPGFFHGLAMSGQYLLPGLFLTGSFLSGIRNFKRKNLYEKTSQSVSLDCLNDMSWQDFEFLVGEYFRRWQFSVEETGSGADSSVDLIARKDREKYLIQCEHSKAGAVGVKAVRELLGVTVGAEATGGILVASSEFTKDAVAFAKASNIALLDGRELHRNMKSQEIFQSHSDEKKERKLKRVKWVLAGLLVVAICFFALHPGNQEHQNKEDDQISRPNEQKESKDFRFTDDQVERAMEEVLSKKKHREPETATADPE